MPCLRTAAGQLADDVALGMLAAWAGSVGFGVVLGQRVKPSWCLLVSTT